MADLNDIKDRADVEKLVRHFYEHAIQDPTIGHFFTEVVKLDFDHHIPVIIDFWESILFGKATYQGNPMLKHLALNRKAPLEQAHFERWLSLWDSSISANFRGEIASQANARAQQIAGLMQHKISTQG